MDDEISLRDVYLVLKRSSRTIVAVTLAAFVLVFAVSKFLPPTYESETLVQALVYETKDRAGQDDEGASGVADVFRTLPASEAMGLGFSKQIENEGPYVAKVIGNAPIKVKSRFDDKKNVLTITVSGKDAAEARQFAEEVLAAFGSYVRDQAYGAATASIDGALEQARLELDSVQAQIDQLEDALASVIPVSTSEVGQAALETNDVPPNVARADNPALAYVSLELAKQRTNKATLEAEIATLQRLATNPEQLRRLSEQAARVNVLSPPPLPQEPVAPRPLFNAALAALLALVMAVSWAFIAAALAEETKTSATPAPVSPASPSEAAP